MVNGHSHGIFPKQNSRLHIPINCIALATPNYGPNIIANPYTGA